MTHEGDTGQCPLCTLAFHYRLVHNGFNDSAYAYCDRCGMTALLSGWSEDIPRAAHLQVHQRIGVGVEPFLAPCTCGGHFRAEAMPRCPYCQGILDPRAATAFIEANAPGTLAGWRWQQSWDGLYAIIINDRVVSDPWIRTPTAGEAEA